MAGKGLHKSPLAAQSCYYYLVPKLLHARSPPRAGPSTELSCLSVCLSRTPSSRPSWTEMGNTSEIISPQPLCGLKFRAREERGLAQIKQREMAMVGLQVGWTACTISSPGSDCTFPHTSTALLPPATWPAPRPRVHQAPPPPPRRSCCGPHGPTRLPLRELTSQVADKRGAGDEVTG